LNFTVSGFYATRANVSVTDNVENPPGSGIYTTTTRRDGDQLVRGWEADVNYNLTNEVNVGGSWGHVYSIYTNFGSAFPEAVGRRVNGIAPENGGAYLKYTPTATALRGFSANVGFTHMRTTPTEAPNAGDTTARVNGVVVVTRSTNQWRLSVPSYTLWNFGVRYRLKSAGALEHLFAINVNNAFDVEYMRANKLLGDGRSVFFTYTLTHGGKR
jgi:outer membrane receptor protein involved in Fe transport